MRKVGSIHKKFLGGVIIKRQIILTTLVALLMATALWAYPSNNGTQDRRPSPGYMATIMPKQELDQAESSGLIKMREEEKLARDVYRTLYEKWGLIIFKNISESEQRHMDAIKALLDKYGLEDPVTSDEIGDFSSQDIKNIYEQLVSQGMQSIEDALKVGAMIEDLDIADLEELISNTDNNDIKTVYENLKRGSENHIRAFTSWLEKLGEEYTPTHISKKKFEEIVSSNKEHTCNCPLVDAKINEAKEIKFQKHTENHLRLVISVKNIENSTAPMEYFIWVTLPDGSEYSWQLNGSWVPGIKPVYVGTVPNLDNITILDLPPEVVEMLPEGKYIFHFAVDTNPNGMLDIFGMESTSSFEIEE